MDNTQHSNQSSKHKILKLMTTGVFNEDSEETIQYVIKNLLPLKISPFQKSKDYPILRESSAAEGPMKGAGFGSRAPLVLRLSI
ncbi:hypothetical protein HG531_006493 [Fusarium graminearum]|nr:hypothetical protein HG531_006493 [Fusarium graminearum]